MKKTGKKSGKGNFFIATVSGIAASAAVIALMGGALVLGSEWRDNNYQQQFKKPQGSSVTGKVHFCDQNNQSDVCMELRAAKNNGGRIIVEDADANKSLPHVKFD